MNDGNKPRQKPKYGEPFVAHSLKLQFFNIFSCIKKSSLRNSEKMLLSTLHQYAGRDGKVHPKRATLANGLNWSIRSVDNCIKSLKENGLLRTESTGCHSSSEYILLYHEIYDDNEGETPRTEAQILPETIELLEYWNSKQHLTTHKIDIANPNGLVKNVNNSIKKLLDGTYYKNHEEVDAYLKRPITVQKIKEAIDRMSISSGPDYWEDTSKGKMTFEKFIFNPRAKIGTGISRYRFKYPLIHFIGNHPVPLSDSPTKKKSKYIGLVDRLVEKIERTHNGVTSQKDYNKVVKYFESAVSIIEQSTSTTNDSSDSLIRRLPDLIYESLEECGTPGEPAITIDRLGLAVHHLPEMMRRRLIIE